jgi:hypothetical protein
MNICAAFNENKLNNSVKIYTITGGKKSKILNKQMENLQEQDLSTESRWWIQTEAASSWLRSLIRIRLRNTGMNSVTDP